MMKSVMIMGSRNPEGQTAAAAEAFRAGYENQGGVIKQVFLPEMHIESCRQCDLRGWGACREEGRCVVEDDFGTLANQIRSAEGVIFTTPVYFGDLSESMRAFLDRLRRVCCHESGKKGIEGVPAVGICVAGGGGGGAVRCCASLEKVLQTTGCDVVDLIPVRRQNLSMKKDVLRLTGQWFAESLSS